MLIDSTTAATSASKTALNKLSNDYTSFLKLLTAQIQNQDPLQPIDSTAFVSQLAQLTQVEQTVASNANLEQINALLAANAAMSDIQLIGHEVMLAADRLELKGGEARFQYQVEADAGLVSARIKTEDGVVVRELTGLAGLANGKVHTVVWDGNDDQGLPVPDATFVIEMEAKTTGGDPVGASTYTTSRVEELSFDTGIPLLLLSNGSTTTSGRIMSIR